MTRSSAKEIEDDDNNNEQGSVHCDSDDHNLVERLGGLQIRAAQEHMVVEGVQSMGAQQGVHRSDWRIEDEC